MTTETKAEPMIEISTVQKIIVDAMITGCSMHWIPDQLERLAAEQATATEYCDFELQDPQHLANGPRCRNCED